MAALDDHFEDPLQAHIQVVTTGYMEVELGQLLSFNILAMQVDEFVCEALAGRWDNITVAGLRQEAASLDFPELHHEHVLHRTATGIHYCHCTHLFPAAKVRANGGWLSAGASLPSGKYEDRLCVKFPWRKDIREATTRIQVLSLIGSGWAARLPRQRFMFRHIGRAFEVDTRQPPCRPGVLCSGV